ncbi:MAG: FHA domain-containing protein [Anaerolineae bacterium]
MQQGSDSFRLIVRRGPQPNQTYDLNKDVMTIGRDITNDIVINDPEVSRHHIRFTRGAGGFTMEDTGSTNGTYVNGQRLVGAKPLNNGDMIGLGETVTLGYEVVRAGMAAGSSAAPTAQNPVAPYAPPAQSPSPQTPSAAPYGQAQSPYSPQSPQQSGSPYNQPAQQSAASPYGQPQNPYAAQGQQPASAPYGQPGYNYSPPPAYTPAGVAGEYEQPEETGSNPMRWIVIGCIGLMLFCCCSVIVGVWIIDSACLWSRLPLVPDILNALGYYVQCGAG